jgi:hypothetical protein
VAKPRKYGDGKYDAFVQTYSSDHRQWGDDLYYCDVDGIEWTRVGSKWYPVALVEEFHVSRSNDRTWQLDRYRDLADALSSSYGYRVHAYFVKWDGDTEQPEGQQVQEVDVTCLTTGTSRHWSRDRWIAQLRTLRDRVRKKRDGLR